MTGKFKRWWRANRRSLSAFEKGLMFAPILLWFSHQPLMSFGASDTLFLDVSVAEIYAPVLALLAIPTIWRRRQALLKRRAVWLIGAFVLLAAVSLLWTPSWLRGLLTSGLIGIIYLIFLGLLASPNLKAMLPTLVRLTIAGALIMCAVGAAQFVAGIWLPRDVTLLCGGCVADQFGFVRVTGFAVEPQYFGNMLLLPIFLLLHRILAGRASWRTNSALAIMMVALVLTLSRGAIFAFGAGLLVLVVIALVGRVKLRQIGVAAAIVVFGSAAAILAQGVAAQVNPNFSETFVGATAKSLNQLSLGLIDWRPAAPPVEHESPPPSSEKPTNFDGYVEASTDYRLELSRQALRTWRQNPATILFGVGIGGAGQSMADYTGEISALAIVQNEFVEILLELGAVGLAIFATALIGFFIATRRCKWIWAVAVAFIVQWNFFSGYPNALHTYVILAVIFAVVTSRHGQSKLAKKS